MPSIQSRLLYLVMKNRHLLRFRLKREEWDFNTSVPAFRQECEQLNSRMARLPEGITVEPITIDGPQDHPRIYAEWIRPARAAVEGVILYTIGGGYVSGSCNDHRPLVSKLVQGSGIPMLLFEHRLAPEHPFPAALDDTLAAYRWLLEQGFSPAQIAIVGESAGGGLCLAALLAIRDLGLPLPCAGVAISPWTDLKLTGESRITRAKVCLSPKGMAEVCMKHYVGENDPADPWISPLYGDLHRLPPLLINVGNYDTLLDDSTRFAAKAQAAGVDVTLRVGEGMVHCYPLMAPLFPEATQDLDEICAFLREHIGQAQLAIDPSK